MSEPIATPDPLALLLAHLTEFANARKMPLDLEPSSLNSQALISESHRRVFGEPDGAKDAGGAPRLYTMVVNGYAVLLGALGSDCSDDGVRSLLRSYHWLAAVARSRLAGSRKDDLALFLVGPMGADAQSAWQTIAGVIERDERICRKFVWLPPSVQEECPAAVSSFRDRTFLARPWEGVPETQAQELDSKRRLIIALEQSSGTEGNDIQTAVHWWPLLTNTVGADGEELNAGQELVAKLIESYPWQEGG